MSAIIKLRVPETVYVVLDGMGVPCGVYATYTAARNNRGLHGTVVAYVPRPAKGIR